RQGRSGARGGAVRRGGGGGAPGGERFGRRTRRACSEGAFRGGKKTPGRRTRHERSGWLSAARGGAVRRGGGQSARERPGRTRPQGLRVGEAALRIARAE